VLDGLSEPVDEISTAECSFVGAPFALAGAEKLTTPDSARAMLALNETILLTNLHPYHSKI
jgi:hypothetical protein